MNVSQTLTRFVLILAVLIGVLVGVTLVIGQNVPDGWTVTYVIRDADNTWNVRTLLVDRRLHVPIPLDIPSNAVPHLSPDHRFVLHGTGIELRLLNRQTGDDVLVGNGFATIWSPDNARFAYFNNVNGQTRIVTIDESGTIISETPVLFDIDTTDTLTTGSPIWSPNGEHLAIVTPEFGLLMANQDSSGAQVVTPTIRNVQTFAWAPDGEQIAFIWSDFMLGGQSFLRVVNLEDNTMMFVSEDVNTRLTVTLEWSPDGRYLAVATPTTGLIIYDLVDDAEIGPVDNNMQATTLRWSPDSERLIFQSFADNDYYVVDRDGDNLRHYPLTSDLAVFMR